MVVNLLLFQIQHPSHHNLLTLVIHHLADPIASVVTEFARACQTIKAIRIKAVDRNASLIANVHNIWLAFVADVEIRVPEHAAPERIATYIIIFRYVVARMVIAEIRFSSVSLYLVCTESSFNKITLTCA